MSTNHVSVRLDAETIARIDALAPQLSTEFRLATRSDVLRALILTALAAAQAAEPAAVTPPRRDGRGGTKARRSRKSERDPG
jgi:hypothetical protein